MAFNVECTECRHDFYDVSFRLPDLDECYGCGQDLCEECPRVEIEKEVYCSEECHEKWSDKVDNEDQLELLNKEDLETEGE